MKILLYDAGEARNEFNEPIGIEILAAKLIQRFGNDISLDTKWYNCDGDSFDISQYDVIGISINIGRLNIFDKIYNRYKECHKLGIIIVGNTISTFGYPQLLERYPDIICVIGEGENVFVEIIRKINYEHTTDFTSIPNLAFINNNIVTTTNREICNMNEYLPPVRVFNEHMIKNKGIFRIEGSRGCSWNKCSFCGATHKYNGIGWRPIDIEIIINQLIELNDYGIKTVYFSDEDFIGNNAARFINLINQIEKNMLSGKISSEMSFFISIKPIDLLNNNIYSAIKRYMHFGLKELFVGIESGCERQLKRYNRCTNLNSNKMVVDRINELMGLDLSIDLGFIFMLL